MPRTFIHDIFTVMLETKIRLLEDRPDYIIITESPRPWQWGGMSFSPAQVVMILVFIFTLIVKGTRKIVIERAYQTVTINSRILLSRRQRKVSFSEIENIILSPRKVTRGTDSTDSGRQTMNAAIISVSLDLGELSLTLSDKSSLKIVTAYWSDKEIRNIGNKICELLEKPFIEEGRESSR